MTILALFFDFVQELCTLLFRNLLNLAWLVEDVDFGIDKTFVPSKESVFYEVPH